MFCLYVILTISYLRAQTIETSSLPTDSSQPLFKQIEIFSGILTVYFNCKYFPYYTRELLACLLGFRLLGEIPAGAITQSTGMATQMQLEVILVGNRIATRVL